MNGDGTDDLILGAYLADGPAGSRSWAGEAYVIFGSASLPATIDINTSGEDVTIYGATASDRLTEFGQLAVGDLNGDGIDDLILGATDADGPAEGRDGAGEAYVIFGSSSLPATIDLNTSGEDVTIYGATAGDSLTVNGVLAVGDVNGDGTDDLILGTRWADGPADGRLNAGEAYIIFGDPNLGSFPKDVFDLANGDEDVTIYGATAGDTLTSYGTVAAVDVNGDGKDDLILAAISADGPSDNRPGAGEAYVIFGSSSLPATIDLNTSGEDVTIYGADASDHLTWGGALAVGDVNGDGTDDLILGAYQAAGPSDGRDAAGEAYVIFGDATGSPTATVKETDSSGDAAPQEFGTARTEIDFDSGDNTSLTTVEITRADTAVNVPDLSLVADVTWEVTTDRTNFSADVTFDYLNSEVAGLVESDLAVYSASTTSGPFTQVSTILDTATNLASVTGLTGFSIFILIDARDSDSDRIPDLFENNTGTFQDENHTGTNPFDADSDNDGFLDGDEVINRLEDETTDPNNISSTPQDTDGDGLSDLGELLIGSTTGLPDTDSDGLTDLDEFRFLTDPMEGDTDGDGLTDFNEVITYGTVPWRSDSDRDGLDDFEEVITYGTDPFDSDSDDDGLTDREEVITFATDPNDADSDNDLLNDRAEVVTYGTDPNDSDSDNDGLSDWAEVITHGTDPNNSNTDGDEATDGEEVAANKDPLDPDVYPGWTKDIWVESGFSDANSGRFTQPVGTVARGVFLVPNGGKVKIRAGTYSQPITLNGEMSLRARNGTVRIGDVTPKTGGTSKKWSFTDWLRGVLDIFKGESGGEGFTEAEVGD